MSKDFKRIEATVATVIGKPATWICYVAWLFLRWLIGKIAEAAAWLRRQGFAFGR